MLTQPLNLYRANQWDHTGRGWSIHEHATVHRGKPLPRGDYDHNVGELTSDYKALEWLEDHRRDDALYLH